MEETLLSEELEKSFGKIRARILRQTEQWRECYLVDKNNKAHAFAITHFCQMSYDSKMSLAVNAIRNGSLIGQTLRESRIDFSKHRISRLLFRSPRWMERLHNAASGELAGTISSIFVTSNRDLCHFVDVLEFREPDFEFIVSSDTSLANSSIQTLVDYAHDRMIFRVVDGVRD
jgi:hypothetical protein